MKTLKAETTNGKNSDMDWISKKYVSTLTFFLPKTENNVCSLSSSTSIVGSIFVVFSTLNCTQSLHCALSHGIKIIIISGLENNVT